MSNVIIACDFSSFNELNKFLRNFKSNKPWLKIGYQLFYKIGRTGVEKLIKQGYKIFLDLKLHDIPNTVYEGVKSLSDLNISMLTVHTAGGIEMMSRAKQAAGEKIKVLGVTQLTSTDESMLKNELLISKNINHTILHYSTNAKKAGLDGVICSPNEVKMIKSKLNKSFLCITPGIRYLDDKIDDQKRVATPKNAKKFGSDYIVVGRPITKANKPLDVYLKVCKEFKN